MLLTGQSAPSFSLPDADMQTVSLSSYKGRKNVVLYFYPRDDTPGCTLEAIEFSDHEAHERGAILQRECLLLRIRADLDLEVRWRLHDEHIHAVHAVLLRLLERPLVIHFRHRRLVLVVHTRLHLRGDFLERLDEHALAQRALHLADHLHGVGLHLLGKERAIVNHPAAARAAESRAEEQHREDAQHACEDAA